MSFSRHPAPPSTVTVPFMSPSKSEPMRRSEFWVTARRTLADIVSWAGSYPMSLQISRYSGSHSW
jgi:hypothetical protein